MAKPKKDADRRARVEQMRREQKRKERRQGFLVLGAAVTVGAVIIGVAAWQFIEASNKANRDLTSIGASADAAGCQPVKKEKPSGDDLFKKPPYHVDIGTPIDYRLTPPAFGNHWPNFPTGSELRSFYTVDDRPEVERLVHSLEHGHTILWYDETIADDEQALDDVKAIADKFPDPSSTEDHFIAAPWTADDGDPMPDDTHLALTHWSAGGSDDPYRSGTQVGVWQYCTEVSGEVVQDFIGDYPPLDAMEPGGA